jgi:hypothetical protein
LSQSDFVGKYITSVLTIFSSTDIFTFLQIFLPTGTEVLITLSGHYFQPFLNVQVTPSLADWNKTDGLCGLFNGNANDDRQKRPGSTKNDINLSWR